MPLVNSDGIPVGVLEGGGDAPPRGLLVTCVVSLCSAWSLPGEVQHTASPSAQSRVTHARGSSAKGFEWASLLAAGECSGPWHIPNRPTRASEPVDEAAAPTSTCCAASPPRKAPPDIARGPTAATFHSPL
ncbi:hypothetical protein MTO96_048548 [Rhipicephalus appendiculatus]